MVGRYHRETSTQEDKLSLSPSGNHWASRLFLPISDNVPGNLRQVVSIYTLLVRGNVDLATRPAATRSPGNRWEPTKLREAVAKSSTMTSIFTCKTRATIFSWTKSRIILTKWGTRAAKDSFRVQSNLILIRRLLNYQESTQCKILVLHRPEMTK